MNFHLPNVPVLWHITLSNLVSKVGDGISRGGDMSANDSPWNSNQASLKTVQPTKIFLTKYFIVYSQKIKME